MGFGAIGASANAIRVNPIGYDWLFLAALTIVSGSATLRLPSVPATISVSETFVFTSILLFGPAAGALTVALDSLMLSFWMMSFRLPKRNREPIRILFNLAAPALSAWTAAHVFYLTSGVAPLTVAPTPISELAPFLALTAVVYFRLPDRIYGCNWFYEGQFTLLARRNVRSFRAVASAERCSVCVA